MQAKCWQFSWRIFWQEVTLPVEWSLPFIADAIRYKNIKFFQTRLCRIFLRATGFFMVVMFSDLISQLVGFILKQCLCHCLSFTKMDHGAGKKLPKILPADFCRKTSPFYLAQFNKPCIFVAKGRFLIFKLPDKRLQIETAMKAFSHFSCSLSCVFGPEPFTPVCTSPSPQPPSPPSSKISPFRPCSHSSYVRACFAKQDEIEIQGALMPLIITIE